MLKLNFINFTAGGGTNHEVNGQLPNAHNISSHANTKSRTYNRSKSLIINLFEVLIL